MSAHAGNWGGTGGLVETTTKVGRPALFFGRGTVTQPAMPKRASRRRSKKSRTRFFRGDDALAVSRQSSYDEEAVAPIVEALSVPWKAHRDVLYKADTCLARKNEGQILSLFVRYHLERMMPGTRFSDGLVHAVAEGLDNLSCFTPLPQSTYDALRDGVSKLLFG